MRITIDTNVLLRAHGHAFGAPQQLLDRIIRQRHDLILSTSILHELEEVLNYPKIRKVTGMTDSDVTSYVRMLMGTCQLVDLGGHVPFPIPDRDDCDRHLRHKDLEPIYRTAGIEVLTDVELLKRL